MKVLFLNYYKFMFTFFVPELQKCFIIGGSADKIHRLNIFKEMDIAEILSEEQIEFLKKSKEDIVDFTEDDWQ